MMDTSPRGWRAERAREEVFNGNGDAEGLPEPERRRRNSLRRGVDQGERRASIGLDRMNEEALRMAVEEDKRRRDESPTSFSFGKRGDARNEEEARNDEYEGQEQLREHHRRRRNSLRRGIDEVERRAAMGLDGVKDAALKAAVEEEKKRRDRDNSPTEPRRKPRMTDRERRRSLGLTPVEDIEEARRAAKAEKERARREKAAGESAAAKYEAYKARLRRRQGADSSSDSSEAEYDLEGYSTDDDDEEVLLARMRTLNASARGGAPNGAQNGAPNGVQNGARGAQAAAKKPAAAPGFRRPAANGERGRERERERDAQPSRSPPRERSTLKGATPAADRAPAPRARGGAAANGKRAAMNGGGPTAASGVRQLRKNQKAEAVPEPPPNLWDPAKAEERTDVRKEQWFKSGLATPPLDPPKPSPHAAHASAGQPHHGHQPQGGAQHASSVWQQRQPQPLPRQDRRVWRFASSHERRADPGESFFFQVSRILKS